RIFPPHALHHLELDTEASRHVVTDTEVLGVQPHTKARRVTAARHVRRTVHEIPARAGALAEGVDQFIEGQALGAGESHGFGDRLDDARAHDLVGCLGGLTRAYGPEVGDGAAERLQYRLGARLPPVRGARPHRQASPA